MKKDKRKVYVSLVALLIVSVFGVKTILAQAGSESDPIVSKSYVDKKIEEVKELIVDRGRATLSEEDLDEIVTDVVAQLEFYNSSERPASNIQQGSSFKPVEVKKGKILIGKEGTEIILRTGTAFVYSKSENGIVDTTSGKDLVNSSEVNSNHLLIVPRTDNRGIIPTSNCWFMVKGDYDIK